MASGRSTLRHGVLALEPHAAVRLANVYTAAFFLLTSYFYMAMMSSGYSPQLSLIVLATAAIACLLRTLDVPNAIPGPDGFMPRLVWSNPEPVQRAFGEALLMAKVAAISRETRRFPMEHGVLLVRVIENQSDSSTTILDVVQRRLFNLAHSEVYKVSDEILGVAFRAKNLGTHFDDVATALHREFSVLRVSPDSARLVIGAALTDTNESDNKLFTGAKAAMYLAEAHGKETFFRRL
jgi:hypothetical protein